MPVQLQTYLDTMEKLRDAASKVLTDAHAANDSRLFLERRGVNLDQAEIDLLISGQLAATQALQSLLDTAIATIDPNQ